MRYRNTQIGFLPALMVLQGVTLLGASLWLWLRSGFSPLQALAVAVPGALLLGGVAVAGWLRVEDLGDSLRVGFGPLPVWRRDIPYGAMRAVRWGRAEELRGQPLHFFPLAVGMLSNDGRRKRGAFVAITTTAGETRILTPDAQALGTFLEARLASGT